MKRSASWFVVAVVVAVWLSGTAARADVVYVSVDNPTTASLGAIYQLGSGGTFSQVPGLGNFTNPQGIAIDSSGTFYVASANGTNGNGSFLWQITATGTRNSGNLTGAAYGVALDSNGNPYVANPSTHSIQEFNPSTLQHSSFGGSIPVPVGLAFDQSGNLFVASNSDSTVYKINTSGGVSTVSTGITSPYGVAVDPQGNLFVTDNNANKVYKITSPATNPSNPTTFASFPTNIVIGGVGTDSAGNVYVAVDNSPNSTITEFSPLGVQINQYSIPGNPAFIFVQHTAAVPEPSTFALSAVAALGATVYLRRRAKKQPLAA
jgi:tripartite motif-containing protein 71